MKLSVILSTYNQPWALERVLWGYALQSRRDFELVIADDGSGEATGEAIERVRAETGLSPLRVWQEDRGFRKSEILNRAILAAGGDYLIFSDGDCIPRRDFVEVHARLARPGHFLSGGYLKVPAGVSERIGIPEVKSGVFADLGWLRAQGWRPGRRALRLTRSARLAALYDRLTPTRTRFGGHNASTWRDAILAANGFEGEMGYGGLDLALGLRLENLGLSGVQVRFRAICVHLHHERPYRDAGVMRRNREILDRIVGSREVRARVGIEELPAAATSAVRIGDG